MTEPRSAVGPFPLDGIVYEDGDIVVQPIKGTHDTVFVHSGETGAAVGEKQFRDMIGRTDESEYYDDDSITIENDGGDIVLIADGDISGNGLRLSEPEAAADAIWS
jgi:hypothetical protein